MYVYYIIGKLKRNNDDLEYSTNRKIDRYRRGMKGCESWGVSFNP